MPLKDQISEELNKVKKFLHNHYDYSKQINGTEAQIFPFIFREDQIIESIYLTIKIAMQSHTLNIPILAFLNNPKIAIINAIDCYTTKVPGVEKRTDAVIDCGFILIDSRKKISVTQQTAKALKQSQALHLEITKAIAAISPRIGTSEIKNELKLDPSYFSIQLEVLLNTPPRRELYQFNHPINYALITLSKNPTTMDHNEWQGFKANYHCFALHDLYVYYIDSDCETCPTPLKKLTHSELKLVQTFFPAELDVRRITTIANYRKMALILFDRTALENTRLNSSQCIKQVTDFLSILDISTIEYIGINFGLFYENSFDKLP